MEATLRSRCRAASSEAAACSCARASSLALTLWPLRDCPASILAALSWLDAAGVGSSAAAAGSAAASVAAAAGAAGADSEGSAAMDEDSKVAATAWSVRSSAPELTGADAFSSTLGLPEDVL